MKIQRNFLGEFEELVMLAIDFLEEQPAGAYGVSIRERIENEGERSTSYGAIYATVERLEKKGYISSRQGEATPERGGRAKRYYKVETPGLKALNDTRMARRNVRFGLKHGQEAVGDAV